MKNIIINQSIPGNLSKTGLSFLGRLVNKLDDNSKIVEFGSHLGSSSWVIFNNLSTGSTLHCLENWQPMSWIDKMIKSKPGSPEYSQEGFHRNLPPNDSLETIVDHHSKWLSDLQDESIDLFFHNGNHLEPNIETVLQTVKNKVKPGGIICGNDFSPGVPSNVNIAIALSREWGVQLEVLGRVWVIMKPKNGSSTSLYDFVGPWTDYDLKVNVKTSLGETYSNVYTWSGAIHQHDQIKFFAIDFTTPDRNRIDGVFQVINRFGNKSAWKKFGDSISSNEGIVNIRAHFTGQNSNKYNLCYQGCLYDPKVNKAINTRTTRTKSDGDWLVGKDNINVLTALRFWTDFNIG